MSKPDKNYYSISDISNITISGEVFDAKESANYHDILKLSNAHNIRILNCVVLGGEQKENAIDMNRLCSNIELNKIKLVAGKQNALTIKGGCYNIHIEDLEIVPGGNCDIELGGWSDQSLNKVAGVTLKNVTRTDGEPVRLRVVNADTPIIIGGNVKIMKFHSFLAKIYWTFKKLMR